MYQVDVDLLKIIQQLTEELTENQLQTFIDLLVDFDSDDWDRREDKVIDGMINPKVRTLCINFIENWRDHFQKTPSSSVVIGLGMAKFCEREKRVDESIQLLWTGPQTGVSLRKTEHALLQSFHDATKELLIVSYVIYLYPTTIKALRSVIERGVKVRLVMENKLSGKGKTDVIQTTQNMLGVASGDVEFYIWSPEKRSKNEKGNEGRIHAKLVLADEATLFLSSANLTENGVHLNMELGTLLEGGEHPKLIKEHFEALIANKTLERVSSVSSFSSKADDKESTLLEILKEAVDQSCFEILELCKNKHWSFPEPGYEICDDQGKVLGLCELAWIGPKIAAFLKDQYKEQDAFQQEGWTCYKTNDMDRLSKALEQSYS